MKKTRIRWSRDDTELTLLALPTAVWYICFCFLPMFGILIAFKNYRITEPGRSFFYNLLKSETVGFDNFKFLFTGGSMQLVIKLTLLYNIAFQILGILVPVTLAVLMSQLYSSRYAKICQTCMFFPYFMSWVVVTYFVFAFLSPDKGLANAVLAAFGKPAINWYMEPERWPAILIFLNVWKSMGYGMVVYLATIAGIDGSLYEAAVIDGAGKWQQARYITLPILKTTIIMMFILNIGGIVRSDFGLFYQVPRASNSLYPVTETIDVFIYKMLKNQPSPNMASAAAFLQSVLGCALILLSNWAVRKADAESAII
ncbi:MAG: ABC transporter permease [Candidatus Merdivicinus sp.]|jgi:putative aldouronate transport system permease protein